MVDVRINFNFGQPITEGYSNVRTDLQGLQPYVGGYSNLRISFQMSQPLIGGYSVLRNNLYMLQAIYPVLPEGPMSTTPFPGFGNNPSDNTKPAAADPFNTPRPGLTFSVHKKPNFRTNIKEASSGNEVRNQMMQYPRWDFELEYDFLEDRTGAESSLKTILGFFLEMGGSFDTFLFKDPDDYEAVNSLCGTADGTEPKFPLLRTMGAFGELVNQVDDSNPIIVGRGITQTTTIPAVGPYTVTVANIPILVDGGVVKGGTPMVKVATAPAAGQYSVDLVTGVYTFNATDFGDAIVITYTYESTGDYTIELPNHILFTTAPAAGVKIYASFQFYFACRFTEDTQDYEKFMDKLWSLRQCNFRSVIQ